MASAEHPVGCVGEGAAADRFNQIRHIAWDIYDHTKKEIKSWGAEKRAAMFMDTGTSQNAQTLRQHCLAVAQNVLYTSHRDRQNEAQNLMDLMGYPRSQQAQVFRYFLDPFWPEVEAMMQHEVDLMQAL